MKQQPSSIRNQVNLYVLTIKDVHVTLLKCKNEVSKQNIFLKVLQDFIYFQRREQREKGRVQTKINVWLPLTRSLLGTWPATQAQALDWEVNLPCFGSQADTQSTESHQVGPKYIFLTQNELLGWPKSPFSFFCKIRHILHFHQ